MLIDTKIIYKGRTLNKKKLLKHCMLLPVISIIGCSAVPLTNNADKVMVVNSMQKVPSGCKFIGQATGSQGNFFTGTYTSNENLATGAMNDLKNKAAQMGGNYVQLLTNQAATTGSGDLLGDGLQETGVVNVGNVYNCTESALNNS